MSENNGVILESIKQYVSAVQADAHNSKVSFIARSQWAGGTRAHISVQEFLVNGQVASREGRAFQLQSDEPAELGGTDSAPNPVELMAAALCACLTAGIASNAALFEVALEKLEVEVQFEWDMCGVLGLDKSVPNGAQGLHYRVRMRGKPGVSDEQLQRCKETLDRKSAILSTLLNQLSATTEFILE